MLEYKDILECIDGYIIVVDQNDKIIYTNDPDAVTLYKKFGSATASKVLSFNEKYFSTRSKTIDKGNGEHYQYIYYQDVTAVHEYEQSLIKKAMTDSLTRICNRHGIEKAIENYRTALTSSCVVYADIDHFKKINDTYSHDAGDFILSEVAKILSSNIREDDLVGRMGGEEFLIILNSTNTERARPKLEKIRETIKEHDFIWKDNNIKLTMSFGASEFKPDKDSDFERTITEADTALKYSKENGRDQITYFKKMEYMVNDSTKSIGPRK